MVAEFLYATTFLLIHAQSVRYSEANMGNTLQEHRLRERVALHDNLRAFLDYMGEATLKLSWQELTQHQSPSYCEEEN